MTIILALLRGIAAPFVWAARLVDRVLGWNGRPFAIGGETEEPQRHLAPLVLLLSFAGLPIAALGANASRAGSPWAVDLFYLGIAAVFLFPAHAILHPRTTRLARIEAVAVLTTGLYMIRLLREPIAFIDHDEFLHWTTANHILESGRLFSPNALLPISPRFPGLEIVTTTLVWLTGLSVFQAAQCVLFACRAVFVAALFSIYERLSGSARVAACGCLVYTGCSTFLVFDTQFSYESMAVTLAAACLLVDTRSRDRGRWTHVAFVLVPLLTALAFTHHMTAYFTAGLLAAMAVLDYFRVPERRTFASSFVVAAWAIAAPLAWSHAMGNPGAGYLGPVVANGLSEATHLLSFSAGRKLFVSDDGYIAPLWQRAVALASVGLVCLGLSIGFFRSLNLGLLRVGEEFSAVLRRSAQARSGVVLLVLLTIAFPLSMLFRLTKSGWEIGNRMGPFSFFGVAFVVAVAAVSFLSRGRRTNLRTGMLAVIALIVLGGGIISSEGPRLLVPARFRVSSDSSSVGPMAIDAAAWSRAWLGERNLFSADRINRLLLSTYGGQDVASTLQDGYDTSAAVLAPVLGPTERDVLRRVGIDYLAVDLRITTDLPGVGVYFDGGGRDANHTEPPHAAALLKFDLEPRVGKVFDDGSISIYDLKALDGTL